jgi:hypothetical protein
MRNLLWEITSILNSTFWFVISTITMNYS